MNASTCMLHGPMLDVYDIVFQVAQVVFNGFPASLTAFAKRLQAGIASSFALPDGMCQEAAKVIDTRHVTPLCTLRPGYMIKLLIKACGDRVMAHPTRKEAAGALLQKSCLVVAM